MTEKKTTLAELTRAVYGYPDSDDKEKKPRTCYADEKEHDDSDEDLGLNE